ncbi:cystathionine gamma-synthase 1, chloroplastic [Olea europaea subsp. europaea]|uniref:Cystathionine gamma-synthase 1, chloroplastic n=1 Tax=Olea europaea subsp. europaea TaxID=158383 RepID=A0A8S0SZT5_OLEEU|nr:cystathionine gamma-synthase 1, chloroplastic [Olea europaea subsp. europaea]
MLKITYINMNFSRPEFSSYGEKNHFFSGKVATAGYDLSSLVFRFPPNFMRQLSNKTRKNYGNIGVAQVVAALRSNNQQTSGLKPAAKDVCAAAASAAMAPFEIETDYFAYEEPASPPPPQIAVICEGKSARWREICFVADLVQCFCFTVSSSSQLAQLKIGIGDLKAPLISGPATPMSREKRDW